MSPYCRGVCGVEHTDLLQGNETRMGKGKGTFEFWATRYVTCLSHKLLRLPMTISINKGRVIFEIGGVPIREELARDGTASFP
jgi:ribosomal protein L16/L10AE